MDNMFFAMSLFTALLLVVGGTSVVKNPSSLSNYGSFTDAEKASPAFLRYLKDIRKAMCITAAVLVGGALLDLGAGSRTCSLLSVAIVLPLMCFYLFYCQSKVSVRMRRKSRIHAGFLSVFLLGVVVFPTVWGLWDISVRYENDTLHISGMYGVDIPRSEIRHVSLEYALPPIAFRSNGFALAGMRRGNFRTADGRDIKLFLSSDEAPYLYVQTLGGKDIYINAATPDELRELYFRLSGEKPFASRDTADSAGGGSVGNKLEKLGRKLAGTGK